MAPSYWIIFCAAVLLGFLEGSPTYRELDWWETTLIYQIYPRSFKDSNGDGIGDLNGITEKLDYVKEIGVETVWVQPFYKSPMFDMGYDVADFKAVDPLFGTIDDFKRLLKGVHDRGMKLIVDFVPNHSSDESEWFKLSEQRVDPYTDYYVWQNPKRYNDTHTTYPNNWRSLFGGSAWTWREKRQQYSFNQFSSKQPDLNFRSPKVRQEMENVLRFWLDLGVDGFRVDASMHIYEADHLMDEPRNKDYKGANDFLSLMHIYTLRQPESYQLVHQWRVLMDEYAKKDGRTRLICTEDYSPPPFLVQYLGNSTHPGAQVPFYMRIVWFNNNHNAQQLDSWIRNMSDIFPKGLNNWVLDNHDNPRVGSRLNPEMTDSMNMLTLLLPGVASVYYGSEIGMEDVKTRPDQRQDPCNGAGERTDARDASRAPMLWDDTQNAGFTTKREPWLPVPPNYWRKNVKAQQQNPRSHLNIFKRLAALRGTPVFKYGDFQTYILKEWVYMFTRCIESETIAVLLNLGSETEEICAKDSAPNLPDVMFVHTSSLNSGFNEGDKVKISDTDATKCAQLRPKAGLVLSTNHGIIAAYSVCIMILAICSKLLW